MVETPVGIGEQTYSLAQAGIAAEVDVLNSLLAESFREGMGVELREEALSGEEEVRSAELRVKYQNDDWNLRGAS